MHIVFKNVDVLEPVVQFSVTCSPGFYCVLVVSIVSIFIFEKTSDEFKRVSNSITISNGDGIPSRTNEI